MVELGANPFIPRIFQMFDKDKDGRVSDACMHACMRAMPVTTWGPVRMLQMCRNRGTISIHHERLSTFSNNSVDPTSLTYLKLTLEEFTAALEDFGKLDREEEQYQCGCDVENRQPYKLTLQS